MLRSNDPSNSNDPVINTGITRSILAEPPLWNHLHLHSDALIATSTRRWACTSARARARHGRRGAGGRGGRGVRRGRARGLWSFLLGAGWSEIHRQPNKNPGHPDPKGALRNG